MAIHGSLFSDYKENPASDPFLLQNKKLLKINMAYGQVWAKTGSMVAYQGDVRFVNKGAGGLNKLLKQAVTGEGVDVMSCTGQGELFVADQAQEIQVMYLENDMISVNGKNVLAFSGSIEWDIHRIQARGGMMAGGLYNVSMRGTGYVAVTTDGDPVALDVASAPTFADAQSASTPAASSRCSAVAAVRWSRWPSAARGTSSSSPPRASSSAAVSRAGRPAVAAACSATFSAGSLPVIFRMPLPDLPEGGLTRGLDCGLSSGRRSERRRGPRTRSERYSVRPTVPRGRPVQWDE